MINKQKYREDYKNAYMIKFENMFISKYSFEGDDGFDADAQTLFFRTVFRDGQAAVLLVSNEQKAIQRYWPTIDKNVGIGINGRVQNAHIFPAWKNYSGSNYGSFGSFIENTRGQGTPLVNVFKDKVVFYQNYLGEDYNNFRSLKQLIEPLVDRLVDRYLKADLYNVVAGGKIASSSSEAINSQIQTNLYEIGSTIKIAGAFENNSASFNIAEELSDNIDIIEFNLDPNLFLSGIQMYEAQIYKILGMKTNQKYKKERALTGELENENQEFNAADFRIKQAYETFAKRYKDKFNVELKVVDNLAMLEDKFEAELKEGDKAPDDIGVDNKGVSTKGGSNE